MNIRQIKALPADECCVLHTIRISKKAYNDSYEILGYILYERKLSEYASAQQNQQVTASSTTLFSSPRMQDEFDKLIFDTVKEKYHEAQYFKRTILSDVAKEKLSLRLIIFYLRLSFAPYLGSPAWFKEKEKKSRSDESSLRDFYL